MATNDTPSRPPTQAAAGIDAARGGRSATEQPTGTAWKADAVTPPAADDYPSDIEHLQGIGIVERDGVRLGAVEYDLTITPAHLRGIATFEAGNEPKTAPDIVGRLIGPLFQAESFAERVHTLVLDDGRAFDFRVLQPDTNEIIGVSWFRSSSTDRDTP